MSGQNPSRYNPIFNKTKNKLEAILLDLQSIIVNKQQQIESLRKHFLEVPEVPEVPEVSELLQSEVSELLQLEERMLQKYRDLHVKLFAITLKIGDKEWYTQNAKKIKNLHRYLSDNYYYSKNEQKQVINQLIQRFEENINSPHYETDSTYYETDNTDIKKAL